MKLFSKLIGILILVCFFVILTWVYPVEDWFTKIYVWIQFVLAFVAIAALWGGKNWDTQTNSAASILTVIGIFGTFLGIYIGLNTFNATAIEASIPGLLQGLKLAFLTSLVGIGSALNLKFIALFQERRDLDGEARNKFADVLRGVETTGESNLSSKLETLTKAIKEDGKTTRDVLRDMRNDLTDVQGKTLTQLETLTTTVSDEHNQLREDRKTTRNVLRGMRNDLTEAQGKTLEQLETLTTTISDEHNQLREDRRTTRDVLGGMRSELTDRQDNIFEQLKTLTSTLSDKSELIITSQKDEAIETRKTLTDMQSELTDRQGKNFIQLRTLTKTVSYEHNQLRKEFETFSKNVAESITDIATKELISSLTKVIDNFNTQLSTQFGDNFKQLNEAVGRTVEWQKQYRQNMDKLAKEFQMAAKSIDDSRDSLKSIADSSSTIADRSDSIVSSAEKLEPILHTLNDQLGAFSDLRQKATNAFPIIEGRLDDLTTEFSKTVQKVITDSQEQSENLANQYDEFQKVIGGLDNFTSEIGRVTTDVSDIIKGLQASIDLQEQALRNSASYVTSMQTKLDEQLTDSISKLGTNLAALSQQFVKDYAPLTDSLHNVLTIAEGILPKQPGN